MFPYSISPLTSHLTCFSMNLEQFAWMFVIWLHDVLNSSVQLLSNILKLSETIQSEQRGRELGRGRVLWFILFARVYMDPCLKKVSWYDKCDSSGSSRSAWIIHRAFSTAGIEASPQVKHESFFFSCTAETVERKVNGHRIANSPAVTRPWTAPTELRRYTAYVSPWEEGWWCDSKIWLLSAI